jgi:CBS domain-containing protein
VKALLVCAGGRLVGMLTDWDVTVAVSAAADLGAVTAAEATTSELVSIGPEALLVDAFELLAQHRLHHLLVSEGDRFRGMVHLDVDWAELGGSGPAPTASFRGRI